MFKKPKKNFRLRNAENEENEDSLALSDDVDEPLRPAVGPTAGRKIEKAAKERASVPDHLLSFDHDEGEGEVFTIKKSSHSKKVAKKLKKEQQKEKEGVGADSDSGRGGSGRPPGSKAGGGTNGGTSGRSHDTEAKVLSGDKALDMDIDSDDERYAAADGRGRNAPPRHAFKSLLERGEIPDAKLIHMARVKRQMAREMGDYIPVDDTVKVDRHAAKSRLVREDENDGTDDEDERIDMSVNIAARERQKMKDSFLAAEHGSDTESEHEREWEEQQIRKAVGAQQQQAAVANLQATGSYGAAYAPGSYASCDGSSMSSYGGAYTAAAVASASQPAFYASTAMQHGAAAAAYAASRSALRPVTENVTAEQIRRLLKERLDSMDEVHRVHAQELANVAQGLLASQETVDSLESRTENSIVVTLEARYKFFQEMRGFVRDLCECFNEKFQKIGELDSAMLSLSKLRAEKLVKRRQEDIRDQANECSAMTKVGTTVAFDITRQDEARQRRAAEREARRARRRRARLDREQRDHCDGLSSDDEENQSDVARLTAEREKILRDAQVLFDDVVDDFCHIEPIKTRFEQWKSHYGDSYREAYIGLCLPKLFTPLVKLQLIDWNPLLASASSVEQMDWFRSLLFYGIGDLASSNRSVGEEGDDDDDAKLIASIVEKVLIPKLTGLVEVVWDPTSWSQTTRLSSLLRHLIGDYPTLAPESKNTQALFNAVSSRIRRSLDEDVFMPLYSKEVLDRNPAARSYLFRQFWSAAKLLRNVASFSLLLSDRLLMELCLDCLLNRYVMLGLQCCSLAESSSSAVGTATTSLPAAASDSAVVAAGSNMKRIQFLVDALPKHWFRALPGNTTLPQLENLCRFLNSSAIAVYKASLDPGKDSKPARDIIKQIARILVSIHALNHALKLANDYSFKLS